MHPVIHIFGLDIYTFNACAILAVVAAILLFIYQTKDVLEPSVQDTFIALFGADIPFIIAGAVLHNKIAFADSVSDFMQLIHRNTGIAFFGGFIGGMTGFVILHQIMLRKKISMHRAMNLIAPPLMVGHAIGRIGCLMGGCCFGKPCSFGICFAERTPAHEMYGGQTLFPSQLLEAIMLCVMFVCSQRMRRHQAEFYLISYSVIRFLLEFMRGDQRGNEGFLLSPAQVISILILSCTVVCIFIRKRQVQAPRRCRSRSAIDQNRLQL